MRPDSHSPGLSEAREPAAEAVGFVLRLGRALHQYGYAADRLEEVLAQVAERLGLLAQFFSTPTSIFAAFGPQEHQRTFLIRVEPGGVDLGKLAQLDAVTGRVLRGGLAPSFGSVEIDRIVHEGPRYGATATVAAYGLASGAAARFLGGGAREICVAGAIGLAIGILSHRTARSPTLRRVFEPVAAFAASAAATAAAHALDHYSVFIATLAGLIVLIPGLTLTVAMTELSTQHLVSGIARLSGAFMLFLGIAFGVAFGNMLAFEALGPVATSAEPVPLGPWTGLVALVTAPLAFTILLRAERHDAGWILLAGVLAIVGSRLGSAWLSPDLGVFLGALTVGVASNLYARVLDRPAAVTLVPGILLLVPGSIGYRSLASLLDQQVVLGVEAAFKMVLIAAALVSGLLIANVLLPARPERSPPP